MPIEWPPKVKPEDEEPDFERFWRRLGHRKEPPKPLGITTTTLPPDVFADLVRDSLQPVININPTMTSLPFQGSIFIQLATNIPPNVPQLVGDRLVTTYAETGLPAHVRVQYVIPGLYQEALVIGLAVWDVGQSEPFYVALPSPVHLFVGQLFQLDVSFVLPSLRRRALLEIPHTDPAPNP